MYKYFTEKKTTFLIERWKLTYKLSVNKFKVNIVEGNVDLTWMYKLMVN